MIELTVRLPYREPLDWHSMLDFYQARAIAGVEAIEAPRYTRTVSIDGTPGVVSVQPAGAGELQARIRLPSAAELPAVAARLRRMFDLDAETASIDPHLAGDPLLAPLVAARPGLRVPASWDPFELGVRAILGQQVTVRAAARLGAALVSTCGTPLDAALRRGVPVTRLFPDPSSAAGAGLAGMRMPRARMRTLADFAHAFRAEPHLSDATTPPGAVLDRLREIPGIGAWTAEYFALRALRLPDAFPVGDTALQRALERRTGGRLSATEMTARSAAWRPWRAYAAQHLWTSLSDPMPAADGL